MGTFSFFIPNEQKLAAHSVSSSHIVGFDGIPFQSTAYFAENLLQIKREEFDSGRLLIPWRVDDKSTYCLSTATLVERAAPYILPIELCRGVLNQVRNQLASWELTGFSPSQISSRFVADAMELWVEALSTNDQDKMMASTDECILLVTTAMRKLTRERQIQVDSQNDRATSFWQGLRYESDQPLVDMPQVSVAAVAMHWDEIEPNQDQFEWNRYEPILNWCKQQRLCVMGGPFFDLHHDRVPDWLYLWDDRSESIEDFLRRYVSNLASRIAPHVQLWECHAATNAQSKLGLNEEEQLRLSVAVIESIRQVDKKTPLLVTIHQPFGEYLVEHSIDLSPIQLADMIGRAGIGVNGFNLHFDFGADRNQSLFRDVFQIGSLLDAWSVLGMPLVVHLEVGDVNTLGVELDEFRDTMRMIATKPSVQGVVLAQPLKSVFI